MLKIMKKWSFVFFAVILMLSNVTLLSPSPWLFDSTSTSLSPSPSPSATPFLEEDFYRSSCPDAENIVRSTVIELVMNKSTIAPALIRLLFHDCLIGGCDESVLLNSTNGVESERDMPPNQSLKGFEVIEEIKSRLESGCPRIVSCSDILLLAARDSVHLCGGLFYPLRTGRRDSLTSFPQTALTDIPAPTDNLKTILEKFSRRYFSERETVSLLGAHYIGAVHCSFIMKRGRLIEAYKIVEDMMHTPIMGRGVIGVAVVTDAIHDGNRDLINTTKQAFQESPTYTELEKWLGDRTDEYWDQHFEPPTHKNERKKAQYKPDYVWVQCEECRKWRILASNVKTNSSSQEWFCDMPPLSGN